jgi:adenylate cyclase
MTSVEPTPPSTSQSAAAYGSVNSGSANDAGALQVGADASQEKAWTRPMRLHLSVLIVILLLGISLPLMWLSYTQGTRSAEDDAVQQMRALSLLAMERYRNVFGDGLSSVSVVSAGTAFLTPPTVDIEAKTALLIEAIASSNDIDGIYVGYPSGAFMHAVNVGQNKAWANTLRAPDATRFAVRTIEPHGAEKTELWRFLDRNGVKVGERSRPTTGYDPRSRLWYRTASMTADPIAVGPYVMATTGALGLTLAKRMRGDPQIVVGADVLLTSISSLLSREGVSEHARAYVFDDQGQLIVHSNEEMMQRLLASLANRSRSEQDDINDPVLDAAKLLLLH